MESEVYKFTVSLRFWGIIFKKPKQNPAYFAAIGCYNVKKLFVGLAMESKRKIPRVLVTYIEAGMGHIVTAEAIANALKERWGDGCCVLEKYIFRESGNPVLENYERFLVGQVRGYSRFPGFGKLQMAAMHVIGSKNTLKLMHYTAFRRATLATVEEYRKYAPDVIVVTHYFTAFAAVEYRNKYNKDCRVVLYCPDNNVHGWWDNRVDRLYTNNPLATEDALRYKFPRERVHEVFYPTRPAVTEANGSREEYRQRFGIPADKFAVVVADGVYAKAKAKRVTKALLRTKIPLTVCLLAGKNEKLRAKFERMKEGVPENVTLLTYGFLTDAPRLYGACDLFITKAGPNAVLDSVMMGTPIIIDYYATPIEKATKRLFIDRRKCGYYISHRRKIRQKVEELATNTERMELLRRNLSYFDKNKNGASDIADGIADMLGLQKNGFN